MTGAGSAEATFLITVRPAARERDARGERALAAARELGVLGLRAVRSAVLYELCGPAALLDDALATRVAEALLADPVAERFDVRRAGDAAETAAEAPAAADASAPGGVPADAAVPAASPRPLERALVVCRRPGVMDPVLLTLRAALLDLGLGDAVVRARRGILYELALEDAGASAPPAAEGIDRLARRALSNPVIEEVQEGAGLPPAPRAPADGERAGERGSAGGERVEVPLEGGEPVAEGAPDPLFDRLRALDRARGLALSDPELRAIARHYREVERRAPTTCELETIAQTWSEHCKHKTMAGPVRYEGPPPGDPAGPVAARVYRNLLKETIFAATRELDRKDFCLSVFEDNAGVVALDGERGVCIKVETHNHPSALEPYGGAGTGVGGVIRDILGTGLGARPLASLSVFGFGPPDTRPEDVPPGALHPRRVLRGVVEGVRDYGNCMGIPTVAGAVVFDPRYTANPVVFCGTIGVLPRGALAKAAEPGDAIVLLGGRTGRDGIHGATFSSMELSAESERVSSGAVQIGNPIEEKRALEALLAMRARPGLLHAVTDCGAGGLSSAVGEMARDTGAEVVLDRVPLKYEGLAGEEIWISEAQERMVLAVPPDRVEEVLALAAAEGAEATAIGSFTGDGALVVRHRGEVLARLDGAFLHDGLPRVERKAVWPPPDAAAAAGGSGGGGGAAAAEAPLDDAGAALLAILGSWEGSSREPIVRQYDHEVQGGSALKPYLGVEGDGPGDAAVIVPPGRDDRVVLARAAPPGEPAGDGVARADAAGAAAHAAAGAGADPVLGIAIGCGLNPRYERDPYRMARAAVDEAVRNVVATGADPDRVALLDNFAWGDGSLPDRLGALVLACEGAAAAARGLHAPFVSGKDSLNNELRHPDGTRTAVPPTLLITALALHPDARRACSSDLKRAGHRLALVGRTRAELGGSLFHAVRGHLGGEVPRTDTLSALALFRALHRAIHAGLVQACHDVSCGGLAAAAAEMAIGGRLGLALDLAPLRAGGLSRAAALFSESCSRFLCEVVPEDAASFEAALPPGSATWLGEVRAEPALVVVDGAAPVLALEVEALAAAYRAPLAAALA